MWRPNLDLCDGDVDGLDPPGSNDDKGRVWWRMTWVGTCASSASDMVGMCVGYSDKVRMGGSRCSCAFFIKKITTCFQTDNGEDSYHSLLSQSTREISADGGF